ACRNGPARLEGVADLPSLRLQGLDVEECAQLVTDHYARYGWVPAKHVAERLHRHTEGNPLALSELTALLTQGQMSGADPLLLPLPLPQSQSQSIKRQFGRRLSALPADCQRLLSLAAADFEGDMATVVAAAGNMGVDDVAAALRPAEDAGLLT